VGVNCWEVKKCGREPGGARTAELGVCRASTESKADGLNGGRNGGRICWALAGTMCGGRLQGTFAQKIATCMACEFYLVVRAEQGGALVSIDALQARL
jgi:hypothetical protein